MPEQANIKPIYQLYVNGEWQPAAGGATYPVRTPVDNTVLTEVALGGPEDANRAVAAARRAFDDGRWSEMAPYRRARILHRIGDLVEEQACFISHVESRNVGKPLFQAKDDVRTVVDCFRYYAGLAGSLSGETLPVPPPFFSYTRREPIGVCVGIVPWNFPFQITAWKVAPALAAGNTVVLKPASYTPLSALLLAEVAEAAGLPAGVLNVVTGPGGQVGQALVSHPDVDKISFTGETATGKAIMRTAADGIKRVTLELGGKSPSLVFADANLEQAVQASLTAIYFNAGQMCAARSRLLVQRDIYDQFVDRFTAGAAALRVGDPLDPETHMGPLISPEQVETVREYVAAGLAEGAHLVYGGKAPDDPAVARGNFYLPTVFCDAHNQMRVAREEIFGPVATIIPFTSEEEGVRLANETAYGLAATVWTQDVNRAHRVAHRIRAGGVWVNTNMTLFNEAPFGGYKASGLGRDLGTYALESYTEVKHISLNLAGPVSGFKI